MHIISDAQERIQQFVTDNSTTLLTAGGVVGTVVTGVVSFRAGRKYENKFLDRIDELNAGLDLEDENDVAKYTTANDVPMMTQVGWAAPHVLAPIVTGGATIGSIIMANRMSAQKAAALAAAWGLSQKQLEEYKGKVHEKLGGPKAQKIQDEVAQDRVKDTPGGDKLVIIDGSDVLCFDMSTGRYFKSSMEKINKAVNSTNQEILKHEFAPATYFYDELELEPTTWSDMVGWGSNRLVELDISTVLSPEEKPCLAIDFKNPPEMDYERRMY